MHQMLMHGVRLRYIDIVRRFGISILDCTVNRYRFFVGAANKQICETRRHSQDKCVLFLVMGPDRFC